MAFVSAFILTTIIHELGHYLSYLVFGADPTLFHNYVQIADQPLPIYVKIISALAGPFISLLQAIFFGILVTQNRKNTTTYLVFIWLSLLGFVNFFGYLIMTPLSTVGDTGKVAELLHLAYSLRIATAVVGFILLIGIILKVGKYFSNFIPGDQNAKQRAIYVYRIMFFPIMIGSLFNTLLAFPAVALLSVIYPATSPYVIMVSFGSILKISSPNSAEPLFASHAMKPLAVLFLAAIILNRLLTLGVG
jgi:hypothetical protein